jgi:glycosyltransferase involved in cell wall biosynthesis
MSRRKFVCGFYGARDGYQVPLALQEAGLLDLLLTDYYGSGWMERSGGIRARRIESDLPAAKVRGSLSALAARKLAGKFIRDLELRNHIPDRLLARRMARHSARTGADVFTYEPYAVDRSALPQGCRQIVFYYHPHVDTEDAIYAQDRTRFPDLYIEYPVTSSRWRCRTADAWKQADLVLCASSFTKHSLVAAGMAEGKALVVPYGISMEREAGSMEREVDGPLRLLFVGRGAMRKGLHHLLLAWKAAARTADDRLTVVCSEAFPLLRRMAADLTGVDWINSLTGPELNDLYRRSDAVVVPSLCEGFGHVYLEGMSHGCAVIGTTNSALPDVGAHEVGIFTVSPGVPGELAALISDASRHPEMLRACSEAACSRAASYTWENFRKAVREAVARLE